MWCLSIDTSSPQLAMALSTEHEIVAQCVVHKKGSHAEKISQTAAFLMDCSSITATDITHCAVVTGPGSFTGLRIGISFIKGFFFQSDVKILPVSKLHAIARYYYHHEADRKVSVVIAGGNHQFFYQRFSFQQQELQPLTSPQCTSLTYLASLIQKGDTLISDSDTILHSDERVASLEITEKITCHYLHMNTAVSTAQIAISAIRDECTQWISTQALTPEYLQSHYAEKKFP